MNKERRTIAKKRLNILFTCVGRRVVLLRAFRRALDELGVEGKILATDITEASAALQTADVKIIVPRAGNVEYILALKKIVREHKVGLLVPLTDLDLRSLARRKGEFAELGCTVMVGSEPMIKICRDKKRFSNRLLRAGMPAIRTFSLEQFRADPFYPCFVKPFHGSGGTATAKIHNGRELRGHVHTFGERLFVQDYVPGREYTIDVYRTRDGEVKSIVPRQRLVVRSGEVDNGVTIRDNILIDATMKLVGLIDGLWGVFCCQCRRPDGSPPYFFEINPRFGGGATLSIAAGANLPLYLLQEILGRPVTGEVGQFTPNLLLLRYSDDIVCEIEDPSKLPGYRAPFFK